MCDSDAKKGKEKVNHARCARPGLRSRESAPGLLMHGSAQAWFEDPLRRMGRNWQMGGRKGKALRSINTEKYRLCWHYTKGGRPHAEGRKTPNTERPIGSLINGS